VLRHYVRGLSGSIRYSLTRLSCGFESGRNNRLRCNHINENNISTVEIVIYDIAADQVICSAMTVMLENQPVKAFFLSRDDQQALQESGLFEPPRCGLSKPPGRFCQ
jgi:hypothetical protein